MASLAEPHRAGVDLDDFVRRCLPVLYRRLAPYARSRSVDPDDVVHDTLERAFRHRDDFATADDMLHWCVVTGLRRVGEIRRGPDERRHVPLGDMTAAYDGSGATSPDPADVVAAQDVAAAVRRALAGLPAQDRWLLYAWGIAGLSHREIATRLGISGPAVNMQLHRARAKLRRALGGLRGLSLLPLLPVRRHAGLPTPLLSAGAMLATVTTVLQLVLPVGPGAPASRPAREGVAPRYGVSLPAGSGTAGPAAATALPHDAASPHPPAPMVVPPPCTTTRCGPRSGVIVVHQPLPTLPPPRESGDELSLNLPDDVERHTGPVSLRQDYVPVCDHWVPNPAAECRRRGEPAWAVSPPPTGGAR